MEKADKKCSIIHSYFPFILFPIFFSRRLLISLQLARAQAEPEENIGFLSFVVCEVLFEVVVKKIYTIYIRFVIIILSFSGKVSSCKIRIGSAISHEQTVLFIFWAVIVIPSISHISDNFSNVIGILSKI